MSTGGGEGEIRANFRANKKEDHTRNFLFTSVLVQLCSAFNVYLDVITEKQVFSVYTWVCTIYALIREEGNAYRGLSR